MKRGELSDMLEENPISWWRSAQRACLTLNLFIEIVAWCRTGDPSSNQVLAQEDRRRYLEMLVSMGYGGGGVQWEAVTIGS